MSEDDKLVSRALSVSSACLLPRLPHDFDTQAIAQEDFGEFRNMLDEQLHLLLDMLYQNGNLLRDPAFDNQIVQLRVNLMLLTCEQTEPNPYFQTEQKILITSLCRLMDDNLKFVDETVVLKVIQSYKDGLKKDCWKTQLGMIHGFPKFCEIILSRKPEFVNADTLMFILSVGSNLVSHYEPHYKTIGLKIYRHLIKHGDKNLLRDLNIHQVVYSESFKMVGKASECDYDYNDHLYECLLHVASIDDRHVIDSRWCKYDDVMSQLINAFTVETNPAMSNLLLGKIVKFCGVTLEDFDIDIHDESAIEKLKAHSTKENLRTMRWITKLTQMMISESLKLLNCSKNSLKVLQSFHVIYIISIFNINAQSLGEFLTNFNKKLILVLMQVAKKFSEEREVIESVKNFLKTIQQHQHQNPEFVDCLRKVLSHETFK